MKNIILRLVDVKTLGRTFVSGGSNFVPGGYFKVKCNQIVKNRATFTQCLDNLLKIKVCPVGDRP